MSSRGLISVGWWGYFACAAVYVIAGLRAGDWFGLLGSLFFLGATIAFIIEHYQSRQLASSEEEIKT